MATLPGNPSAAQLSVRVSPKRRRRSTLAALLRGGAAAAGLAACLCPAAGAAEGALDRLRNTGVFVIAHRESAPPFSYMADGEPAGYSIDICRSIASVAARSLGLKNWQVKFKQVTATNRFEMIERGEVDLECAATSNTAERRKRVSFTIPHFIAAAQMMVRKDDPFDRIEDLDGRAVTAVRGTTNLQSLQRQAAMKGVKIDVKAAVDRNEAIRWLADKKVDAVAMDDVALFMVMAETAPNSFRVVGKPMAIEPYSIAFQKDDAALKKVADEELRRLIRSGELEQLYDKWFKKPIAPGGIQLGMPMSHLLRDYMRFPTDFVPD